MLQVRIGVQLASLRMPFSQGLLAARHMGADAVEIDVRRELQGEQLSRTGVRQVRKMLDDLELRVSCVSFRTRRGYDAIEGLDRRVESTKEALRLAYDLGTNAVVNHVGRVPADGETATWGTLREALTDIGKHGQRVGAMLAAETGPDGGADLLRLVRSLPEGSLGIDLNPGLLILHGHSPQEAAAALGDFIVHVHATDATRDLAQGRGVEVPLGRGNSEFPELLAILEERHYHGFVTVERRESRDPVADLTQAVQFLRNL